MVFKYKNNILSYPNSLKHLHCLRINIFLYIFIQSFHYQENKTLKKRYIMRRFSTTLRLMLASALCISMASCAKTEIIGTASLAPEQEPESYEVTLGLAGEIDINEEPLTRAGEGTSLYGIEVYSAPYSGEEEEGKSTTWTRYAYGFYGSSQNITINLLKGFKYKFAATMVEDGQNKIASRNTTYEGNNVIEYGYPFYAPLLNKFIYQPTTGFSSYFTYGYTSLAEDSYYTCYAISCGVNRYYGELVDYIPGLQKGERAKIYMKRTNFGAKFIAQGKLADTGSLEVQISGAKAINMDLAAGVTEFFGVYTFKNVKSAFLYESEGEYSEIVDITFNWHHANGTVVPFGTHKITYKRNTTTVVTIRIDSTDAEDTIGIECEESELVEDGENDVTIENGERVDTDIEGNV